MNTGYGAHEIPLHLEGGFVVTAESPEKFYDTGSDQDGTETSARQGSLHVTSPAATFSEGGRHRSKDIWDDDKASKGSARSRRNSPEKHSGRPQYERQDSFRPASRTNTDPMSLNPPEKGEPKAKKKIISVRRSSHVIERLEKKNEKYRMEIRELVRENERLQSNLDDQDLDIRAAQDLQAKVMDSKGYTQNEDDSRIRGAFLNLASRWKNWSKTYAPSQQAGGLANPSELLARLGVHTQRPRSKFLTPSLLLNACLAAFVTGWIIKQPFFFLPSNFNSVEPLTPDSVDECKAFQTAYERARNNGNPSLAHTWRSLTLQLLGPGANDSTSESAMFAEASRRKSAYYQRMTQEFTRMHRAYFDVGAPNVEKELLETMREAGELSSRLWKSRIWIECRSKVYYDKPFKTISNEVEAHPSQHFHENDSAKDNLVVDMVVQPTVLAFPSEDSNERGFPKVWLKGVVLLGERGK